MSRSARVTAFLGLKDYDFLLGIGELEALEEARTGALAKLGLPAEEASILRILMRLQSGHALIPEIKLVLQLGLVGGGMPKSEAFVLVEGAVVPPDLATCCQAAFAVLGAAWFGGSDDAPGGGADAGERTGRGVSTPASRTAGSAGASSSGSAPRSASRRRKPAG